MAANYCPPEDVGGIPGYNEMVTALTNHKHPEYNSYSAWLGLEDGEVWKAEYFSMRQAASRMAMLG